MENDLVKWRNWFNEKHIEYIKISPAYRNIQIADDIEYLLKMAKDKYYNTGNPIMTDVSYDWLEDVLKVLRPNSEILQKVG